VSLRKALVLTEYVELINEFAVHEDVKFDLCELAFIEDHCDGGSQRKGTIAINTLRFLAGITAAELLSLEVGTLPADTPAALRDHIKIVQRFSAFRDLLYAEMAACNDATLSTDNKNIVQTVQQIIDLETEASLACIAAVRGKLVNVVGCADATASGAAAAGGAGLGNGVPRGLMCPITLTLMADPVIAADGHTYERSAIEQWLANRANANRSPCTGLVLQHAQLVPNIALKMVIQEHIAHTLDTSSSTQAADSTPAIAGLATRPTCCVIS
jgi:hypothetical protein